MSGLRVIAETIAGLTVVLFALFAIDCVKNQKPPVTPIAPLSANTCPAKLTYAPMLCNTTTRDGAYECAICPNPDRTCLSTTHVYCVSAGCDDPNCKGRTP